MVIPEASHFCSHRKPWKQNTTPNLSACVHRFARVKPWGPFRLLHTMPFCSPELVEALLHLKAGKKQIDSWYHILSCKLPSQNDDGNVNAPVIYSTLCSQTLCPWTTKSLLEWDGEEIHSNSYDLAQKKNKWLKLGWLNKNKHDWKTGVWTLTLLIKPKQFFTFSGQRFRISGMKVRRAWKGRRDADGIWESCRSTNVKTNRAGGTRNQSALLIPKNISSSTAFQGNYFNLPGDNTNCIWLVISLNS